MVCTKVSKRLVRNFTRLINSAGGGSDVLAISIVTEYVRVWIMDNAIGK